MKTTVVDLSADNFNSEVEAFLTRLLASDLVGSLLVPKRTTGGDNYVHALIKNPALLADTDIGAPVMPVQAARIISNLTFRDPGEKIGVVVRPCEARALVELAKFKQITRESLVIIAVDCLGTYEPKVFSGLVKAGRNPALDLRKQAQAGACRADAEASFRAACEICEYPALDTSVVDIVVGIWGVDTEKQLYIEASDVMAEALSSRSVLTFNEQKNPRRQELVATIKGERIKARDQVLGDFRSRVNSIKGIQELLSTCLRCHNCMINCPICYCRECVFRSPTFEHTPDQYLGWAKDKGAIRMPANTVMFHLTRLNHMVISCIGCGMCDTACPSDIPVMSLFRTVGDKAQKMMAYEPGRSYDEPAPATTFRDSELVTEAGMSGH
ncbi:MAG: formate dehydrogenase [Deltaproteobacteria bacterium]|nr:formate dehydrogenase [Deltaproteobacteria bacterium]